MPPKRKKPAAAASSSKASNTKRRSTFEKKKRLEDTDILSPEEALASVRELWKEVIQAPRRVDRQRALHRAVEEEAALPRFVWPTVLRQDKTSTKGHIIQASQLVAALISWEHREGVNLDTALSFLRRDSRSSTTPGGDDDDDDETASPNDSAAAAWKTVCQHVFSDLAGSSQNNNNNDDDNEDGDSNLDYDRFATATHFLAIAWAVAQQGGPSSFFGSSDTMIHEQTSTWDIWHYMPSRVRELALKEQQQQVQLSEQKPSQPPFVVTVVQQALHLMEGGRLKLHFSSSRSDDNDDDDDDHRRLLPEWNFLHRALELLIDLLSSGRRETRQILVRYLDAMHFSVRGRLALGTSAASRAQADLLLAQQLLERLDEKLHYSATSHVQVRNHYHARASILQKMCHRHYPDDVPDVIYAGVGVLCQTDATFLRQALGGLSDGKLLDLLYRMRLVDKKEANDHLYQREFLLQVLQHYLVIPNDPLEVLQHYPLYPTEKVLWDFHRIPPSHSSLLPPSHVLALPKLRTRFLSFADYLGRNFELMRLESAYEIRSDICDVVRRVRPVVRQQQDLDANDNEVQLLKTEFSGWARMALELAGQVEIKKVAKPSLGGGLYPSQVLAEVSIDLSRCGDAICREWDALGEYDNIFLVAVDATKMTGRPAPMMSELDRSNRGSDRRVPDEDDQTFPQRFGVTCVRGCMILHVRDEKGNILSDPSSPQRPVGKKRTFLVALDPTQYAADARSPGTELYETFNLVVRRHGRENNFKAILETIRSLMSGTGSINRVIPPFLQQVILGQGEPNAAHYKSETIKEYASSTVGVADPDSFLDYGDTFLDEDHFKKSFPDAKIEIDGGEMTDETRPRCNYRLQVLNEGKQISVKAQSYPFPANTGGNPVRFTPRQVEAIRAGLSPGLSIVVGPPGTGKTDVAVQIIASLYHSFPDQRTVVITHSNAALNDIFEKVVYRGDVEERSLLRLGSGERDLQTDSTHDFTKTGRVAYCLEQRGLFLEKVQGLSESLGLSGKAERSADGLPGYTCETAEYFRIHHFRRLVRTFEKRMKEENVGEEDSVSLEVFPFSSYFGCSGKIKLSEARSFIDMTDDIFDRLALYRPFELLRTQRQRTDYLLMKQTRIVAMTCTHAAIARSHLVDLGFEYDNVVIEEAGQMVEIESFIPLLLQRGDADGSTSSSRLKRVSLMGDHNQLPPVIKNMSFAKYSNLDQSLFTRMIRLGVPYTQLDKQGRARPEIAQLYSWRYNNLGNLSHVTNSDKFQLANPGFVHSVQLINVEDFEGKGESSPSAYFYQNVGEAEYAVALFQYMVLIGHNPWTISILTTYNGQKQLIEDIITQRCGDGTPLQGVRPRAVSTVDQYQGQQNDYILLSLVRTASVGHLRDVRRLVVAVSRARRGLYIFCRQSLFAAVHQSKKTFDQLVTKPTKLELVLGENYPSDRKVSDEVEKGRILQVDDVSHVGAIVHKMQEDLVNQAS